MTTHTTGAMRLVAGVACTGLVIASAGFGAVYAYTIGIQHGIVLATLTIVFAIALELVKPLAIHGAFEAFRSWRTWGKAIALSVLGLVAVSYSLTAELALTAASRSDLVAKRGLEGSTAATDKTKYDQALEELKLIHPSRTVAEVEADIARTKNLKAIARLKGEKARTERRERLQVVVRSYRPGMNKVADPGSTAIATYLASVGIIMSADLIAQWLNLVPVLALELGSALAMVLVTAVSPPRQPSLTTIEPRLLNQVVLPARRLLTDRNVGTRHAVAELVVNHLTDHGGSLSGSERSLAKALGASKPTLRRAIRTLARAGVLSLATSKQGTQLTLLP